MSRPTLAFDPMSSAVIFIRLSDCCCSTFFLSPSDTSDLSSIKQCAQQVYSLVGTGGLNLLINNAGIVITKPLLETSPEDIQACFNTNLMGPMNIIKVSQRENVIMFETLNFNTAFFFSLKEGNWVMPSVHF